mmetsp:Transcript_76756/g.144644  ORF Transcript_76756/g.144644 Transcript_76756/m.144644 type:complete len:173 (+) Transcript_76756:84-602(+)
MQKIALVLAVLACTGSARPLPASDAESQQVLTNLLLTLNPEAAFNSAPPALQARSRSRLAPAMLRPKDSLKLSQNQVATAAAAGLLAAAALHPDAAQAFQKYQGVPDGKCVLIGVQEYCEPYKPFENFLAAAGCILVPFGGPIFFFLQGFFSEGTDISDEIEEQRREDEARR